MAEFEPALNLTLQFEGGYSNDFADLGGETYRGISRKNWPLWEGWGLVDSAKNVSNFPHILDSNAQLQAMVAAFYKLNYWKPAYFQILSQPVASKIFDMTVNMSSTAVKLLQTALLVTVDGFFGAGTLSAVNAAGESLLPAYKAKLTEHYQNIVAARPAAAKFLNGWLRRANS